MHRRTATVLALISKRRDSIPRTTLARAAWRTLLAAVDRGDENAVEAGWQAWLCDPDDETWESLERWRGERELLAAATDPARAASARFVIGEFCLRRGMLPETDIERVLFYVLIGQLGQLRAVDPDGSVLAVGYRAAGPGVRAVVREALAGSGDLDVARSVVVVGGGDRSLPSSADERRYLVGRYAADARWRELWRLALDLPLAEAAAAARVFPAAWGPADEAGRDLLARLARTRPETIEAVGSPPVTRISLEPGTTNNCHFAPDGSELAVDTLVPRGDRPPREEVIVYALPDGTRLERLRGVYVTANVRHLGETIVYSGYRHPVVRYSRLRESREEFPGTLRAGRALDRFFARREGELWYGTAEPGSAMRKVPEPGPEVLGRGVRFADVGCIVSEPGTGRLAVVFYVYRGRDTLTRLVVLDQDFRPIAWAPMDDSRFGYSPIGWMGFFGPDRLITFTGQFQSWRVEPELIIEAETGYHPTWSSHIGALPFAGQIVYNNGVCLDAATLSVTSPPSALEELLPWERLFVSADGVHAARLRDEPVGSHPPERKNGELEIRDLRRTEIGALLARPLADARRSDQARLARLVSADTAEVTGLLRACLEYRFGADVAIGAAPAGIGGDDDIALAGRDRD